jgi:hypothetical protein
MKDNKQQWLDDLDEITAQFSRSFGSLSPDQLNEKPAPDRWSVAENILHLIKLNKSYFPIIDSVKEGGYKTPFIGRFNVITSFLGNMIYNSVLPDRKRKIKTFTVWEPEKSDIDGQIITTFRQHQEELKRKIADLTDEELQISISSPANKYIVYKLHRALDLIVQHERRHYVQAKEVVEQLELKGQAV